MKSRISLIILLIISLAYTSSIQLIPESKYRSAETKINKLAHKMKGSGDLKSKRILIKSINSNFIRSKSGEEYFFDSRGIFTLDDNFKSLAVGDELRIHYLFDVIYFVDSINKKNRIPDSVVKKEQLTSETNSESKWKIDELKESGVKFYVHTGTINQNDFNSRTETIGEDPQNFSEFKKTIKDEKICKVIEESNNFIKLKCISYIPITTTLEDHCTVGSFYSGWNIVDENLRHTLQTRGTPPPYIESLLKTNGFNKKDTNYKTLVNLTVMLNSENSVLSKTIVNKVDAIKVVLHGNF